MSLSDRTGKITIRQLIIASWLIMSPVSSAFTSAAAWASHPPTPLNQFYQDVWTTRQGLPHNSINGITQTNDGRLWLATWEGAVRFNGHQFEIFDLHSDIGLNDAGIMNVQRTAEGGIMLMGARGSLVYQQQQRWQRLDSAKGLINHVLLQADGGLWIATAGDGLLYVDHHGNAQDITRQLGLNVLQVSNLLADNGTVYAASSVGLLKIEQLQPQIIGTDQGLPDAAVNNVAWYNDTLLVATDRGLYQQRGDGFVPFHPDLSNIAFTRLLVDHHNDVWAGSVSQGLFRISALGVEQLTTAQGLPNNRVSSLYEDTEQSLWVGTNGGLFRLRDAPFTTIDQGDGLAGDYVRTVLQHSQGSLWVGTSNGLSVRQHDQWQRIELPERANSVLSLAERDDGSMLIGTYGGGLLHWRDGTIVQQWTVADGLLANTVSTILAERSGAIWLGSFSGINVIEADGQVSEFVNDRQQAQLTIAFHQADDGSIWIGTGRGLLHYREQQFDFIDLSAANRANYVFDIEAIDQWLWLATDRGLIRFDPRDRSFKAIGSDHGMPVDKLFQVQPDGLGQLWLTSNRGTMRINYQAVNALLDSNGSELTHIDWYRESDGMVSSQANGGSNPAIAVGHNGLVWIPTAHGLVVTDPTRVDSYTEAAPPTLIESISIDNQRIADGTALPDSRDGAVAIEYAGIGFIVPERIEYHTRLVGFDEQWRQRGRQTVAEFTNLAPGQYRFEVSASYNGGRSRGHIASVSFTVLPKFWQQAWFWLVLGVFALVLVALVVHFRTRVLSHRALVLQQQVAEKTQQLQQQALMFEQLSRQDSLTKLPNRRGFDLELKRQFTLHERQQQPLSLAIIDVDHFKSVNDTFSHQVGDQTLAWLAQLLQQLARQSDVVARWGGEEFTLLMPQTHAADAWQVCERIRAEIAATPAPDFMPGRTLTVSIGVACSDTQHSIHQLLAAADSALYDAKQGGRNCVRPEPS